MRGHSKETATVTAPLGIRFLMWVRERKDPEGSEGVQGRKKRTLDMARTREVSECIRDSKR